MFIAGKDAFLALDMLDAAAKALLKPFEISLFADPAGSFTTAAAMLAVVEKTYRDKFGKPLAGARIAIYGATGVVGTAAGVIGALEGAQVTFVGHDGTARVERHAEEVKRRFGVEVAAADGSTPEGRRAVLGATEIALCAAKAGCACWRRPTWRRRRAQDRRRRQRRAAARRRGRRVATPTARRWVRTARWAWARWRSATSSTATESGLFKQMTEAAKPLKLDFRQAFALARTLA